jgi:hypothetical protein
MGHDVRVTDSAIHFQPSEGLNAVVALHDGDPEYLCIRAFFNAPESPVAADRLLAICNETSLRIKGIKATVDGDIAFSIEMLVAAPDCLPTPEHLQAILPRALSMLLCGIQKTLTDLAVADVEDVEFRDEG